VGPAEETEKLADRAAPSYDRSGEGLFGRDGWRELVSCLTEDQWETLRLHFYEGYTFAEIATGAYGTISTGSSTSCGSGSFHSELRVYEFIW
jgi:hypothetical protein